MFEAEKKPLDFVIDKLTNSIENTITAEVFDTLIVKLSVKDLKEIRKSIWRFIGQKN